MAEMQMLQFLWILIALSFCRCSGPDLHSTEQQDIIRAFNKAHDESFENRNPDSTLVLTNQVLLFQPQIADKKIISGAYTNAALCHESNSRHDLATHYYLKALELAYEMGVFDKISVADAECFAMKSGISVFLCNAIY